MNRDQLVDNLYASAERREVVTLTLRPVTGERSEVTVTGRVEVAEAYTSRHSLVVVLLRGPEDGHLAVGLTMIKDFMTGRPA